MNYSIALFVVLLLSAFSCGNAAAQYRLAENLRGSTTERVLRGARCPVLAIPTGAH